MIVGHFPENISYHMRMSIPLRYGLFWLTIFGLPVCAAETDSVTVSTIDDSGMKAWSANDQALGFQLIQMQPDYVRASYESMNLPDLVLDAVGEYCVFGTILKNNTARPLHYRVSDWRYTTPDGNVHPVKSKSDWVSEWREAGVKFRWSMLADDQVFQQGDWMQGFTTIHLKPGDRFDFQYSWSQDGETQTRQIADVQCARNLSDE